MATTIKVAAETPLPPERVLEAARDFSKRRTEIFPAVRAEHFEIHEQGDDWADVTEGTPAGVGINWERCRYEWGQHVLLARDAGLTDPEIDRLARPDAATVEAGEPGDALLVRFVDEFVEFTDVTDATWDAMNALFTVEQIFELVMLVGLYRMAGGFLNVTGVEPEPYLPTWPDGARSAGERTPVPSSGRPA